MNDMNLPKGYFGIMQEWMSRVASPNPEYMISFNNGDCLIEYWAPRMEDTQEPHDRDEVYIITAGHSDFSLGEDHRTVTPGDLIFVPAGMAHKFFNFSDDLAMWIVFFGMRHAGFDPTP